MLLFDTGGVMALVALGGWRQCLEDLPDVIVRVYA